MSALIPVFLCITVVGLIAFAALATGIYAVYNLPTGTTSQGGAFSRTSVTGPAGSTGPTGSLGITGDTGPTGSSGPTGSTGPTAPDGRSATLNAYAESLIITRSLNGFTPIDMAGSSQFIIQRSTNPSFTIFNNEFASVYKQGIFFDTPLTNKPALIYVTGCFSLSFNFINTTVPSPTFSSVKVGAARFTQSLGSTEILCAIIVPVTSSAEPNNTGNVTVSGSFTDETSGLVDTFYFLYIDSNFPETFPRKTGECTLFSTSLTIAGR